nr:MAG TPA: hypothetical protein [Inoviridae sp.]
MWPLRRLPSCPSGHCRAWPPFGCLPLTAGRPALRRRSERGGRRVQAGI